MTKGGRVCKIWPIEKGPVKKSGRVDMVSNRFQALLASPPPIEKQHISNNENIDIAIRNGII